MYRAKDQRPWIDEGHDRQASIVVDRLLHELFSEISDRKPSDIIRKLTDSLHWLKFEYGVDLWKNNIVPQVRSHDLIKWIHQCPLTRYSYDQPRGYPGDAGLLDIIYCHPIAAPHLREASATGKSIFDFTLNVPACEAVRDRRRRIAQYIEKTVGIWGDIEVLAVACGHLREAEIVNPEQSRQISRWVATDQDLASLQTVGELSSALSRSIQPMRITVRDFIIKKHDLKSFDFIYVTGLYDYLNDKMAARLTTRLFELLKPGGTLLGANFLPDIWEQGYMEACMDWHLLYRDERNIKHFSAEINETLISSTRYYTDNIGCIGYLELVRS